MDDVQENLGALVAHYVPVTCPVLALDLNLDYTYAANVGRFPETVVLVVMHCYRRLVACRRKRISESNFARTKINSLLAISTPSSLLQMSVHTYLILSWKALKSERRKMIFQRE